MKPVSIVFIIISVLLIILGAITCSVGVVQAKTQNVQLFDTKNENDEIVNTFDFSSEDIGKIEINAGDADVKIVCGAESNKIEVKNYSSTNYVCQVENKALVMESGFNILSLTDLAQGEIRFKGFRYYLSDFLHGKNIGPKSVTVYVSDTKDIKIFDISVGDGNVEISKSNYDSDFTVNVVNGDVTLSEIITNSSVSVNVKEKGDVTIEGVVSNVLSVKTEDGSVKADASANEITVSAGENAELSCGYDLETYNFELEAPEGKITLAGTNIPTPYKAYNPNFQKRMEVTSLNGKISISQSEIITAE